MSNKNSMNLSRLALSVAALLPMACSGASSSSGASIGNGFQLIGISVQPNAIWQINRPIDFTFSEAVDFSTVSLNTIAIRELNGLPASGSFSLLDSKTIRFQPTCPMQGDLSDSGFQVGGVTYQIAVFGSVGGNGLTVESGAGAGLESSQYLVFTTPASAVPASAFIDIKNGPPSPVIRQRATSGGTVLNPDDAVCFIELAGGAAPATEFEFDASTQSFSVPTDQGLNLFSDAASKLAVLIEFNQPVNPSSANISSDRVFLERLEDPLGAAQWVAVKTAVSLERNCSETGATLRLAPFGILPQDSELRVVVSTEFEDLVGDRNQLQVDNFAHFRTRSVSFPAFTDTEDAGDEILEDFTIGGEDLGSLEDPFAPFPEPRAIWGGGRLSSAVNFPVPTAGSGLVDFDLVIQADTHILLDTSGALSLQGGDIGANLENLGSYTPSKTQLVSGGTLNVRHLVIQAGGSLTAQGVNPVVINASGSVVIEGLLDVSGFNRPDVSTLNTGNQPEPGAAGAASGGAGGTASFLTTTSTPQGGNGFGPNNLGNFGGLGGESGFAPGNAVDFRRPGGGGGGAFGADSDETINPTDFDSAFPEQSIGMIAGPGLNGALAATGAVSGVKPPKGGNVGLRPFFDANDANNFFGVEFDGTDLVQGELQGLWAGSGGGAGGDSIPDSQFPHSSWTPSTDDKGCGGGGGAGALHILCLGDLILRNGGQISVVGGQGGAGENTSNNNHVGGGSGGGSGGHVVLEVGGEVIFDSAGEKCIAAQGGKGGSGNSGGTTGGGSSEAQTINAGGAGGPGLIQIHVGDPAADIKFTGTPPALDLETYTFPDAITLVPSFGTQSKAITQWIPIGGASVGAGGAVDPVTFMFGGVDPATGLALDLNDDNVVDLEAALLGPVTLQASPTVPFIGADLRTLVLDPSVLYDTFSDVYLRNPELLRGAVVVLSDVSNPASQKRFSIASAAIDFVSNRLTVEIEGAPALDFGSFAPLGPVQFAIHPKTFGLITDGSVDSMPDSVAVRFRFEGALAGTDGLPDVGGTGHIPMTSDISDLNAGTLDFIRVEVLFDLDVQSTGLTAVSPRPSLDFTRILFRF